MQSFGETREKQDTKDRGQLRLFIDISVQLQYFSLSPNFNFPSLTFIYPFSYNQSIPALLKFNKRSSIILMAGLLVLSMVPVWFGNVNCEDEGDPPDDPPDPPDPDPCDNPCGPTECCDGKGPCCPKTTSGGGPYGGGSSHTSYKCCGVEEACVNGKCLDCCVERPSYCNSSGECNILPCNTESCRAKCLAMEEYHGTGDRYSECRAIMGCRSCTHTYQGVCKETYSCTIKPFSSGSYMCVTGLYTGYWARFTCD